MQGTKLLSVAVGNMQKVSSSVSFLLLVILIDMTDQEDLSYEDETTTTHLIPDECRYLLIKLNVVEAYEALRSRPGTVREELTRTWGQQPEAQA
jgi:hypothetical protein